MMEASTINPEKYGSEFEDSTKIDPPMKPNFLKIEVTAVEQFVTKDKREGVTLTDKTGEKFYSTRKKAVKSILAFDLPKLIERAEDHAVSLYLYNELAVPSGREQTSASLYQPSNTKKTS